MDMQSAIRAVTARRDLGADEMTAVMRTIMSGEATPAQIGGFLIGLRMKGETVDEIAAAAQVMRELATPVEVAGPHLVDIVGTGGDSAGTFNISTTSAFVVAAALPERLDTERLPCFATRPPAAATTKALVVEILKVPALSPPVPTMSTR